MDIRIESLQFRWAHSGFEFSLPSLHIESGASVAIVGPSGSGKTTFLKLLAGIEEAISGSIHFGPVNLTDQNGNQRRAIRQRSIGYVFQDFKLIEYLNVEENILTPWRLSECNDHTKSKMDVRVSELVDALRLTAMQRRPIHQLSQGERQRTAIARALLLKPGLVLADEPTGNVDDRIAARLMHLFEELNKLGTTVIIATHNEAIVQEFGRPVLKIDGGRLRIIPQGVPLDRPSPSGLFDVEEDF